MGVYSNKTFRKFKLMGHILSGLLCATWLAPSGSSQFGDKLRDFAGRTVEDQ